MNFINFLYIYIKTLNKLFNCNKNTENSSAKFDSIIFTIVLQLHIIQN